MSCLSVALKTRAPTQNHEKFPSTECSSPKRVPPQSLNAYCFDCRELHRPSPSNGDVSGVVDLLKYLTIQMVKSSMVKYFTA